MAYVVDNSDDLLSVDGVETVTVCPRNPVAADIANIPAVRGDLNYREISLGGGVGTLPTDSAFELRKASLGGYSIKAQDLIKTADGAQWRVLSSTGLADGATVRSIVRLA